MKWFKWFCEREAGETDHRAVFRRVTQQHFPGGLPGPFNDVYRGATRTC